jgi:hypothetical protein
MIPSQNYKPIVFSILGIIATTALIIWVVTYFNTATIEITASGAAEIFVRQNDNDFKPIGKAKSTYKTRSIDTVFVEARTSEGAAQKSVTPQRRQRQKVHLEVIKLAKADLVAEAPLTHPLIEGGFVYGINPSSYGLMAKPLVGNNQFAPVLPITPRLRQIIWFDSKNYLYVSFAEGSRLVQNGQVVRLPGSEGLPFTSAAKISASRTALASADGLFVAEGTNFAAARKISEPQRDAAAEVFVDQKYIYYSSLLFNTQLGSESVQEAKYSLLQLFDHEGRKQREYKLPIIETATRITSLGDDRLAILTKTGLRTLNINNEEIKETDFSFGQVKDMVNHNNQLLLLGDAGLWRYESGNNQYTQVATYNEGETYIPKSLTVIDSAIYFSTGISDERLRKNSEAIKSGFYRVNL